MPTRRKLGIGLFLILFLTSAACLVYYLILLPAKTPLVAAVAVEYRWPLPPNGWAREDLDALTNALGGQTVSIREVPFSGSSNSQKLGEQIELAGRRVARQGTVLVYLSAHGAVDGEGQPCLVLPQADPVDSGTWLPLSQLLQQLKSIEQRSGCRHLLILDCNRQRENLSLGLLDNRFAEGVGEAVNKVNAPGLVVLNSTSRDQMAWASVQLQGSVFGAYLRLGMAGDADRDQNGRVSLRELHRYLQQHVDTWARDHRNARQTPTLYPADAADFPVAWSLNSRTLRRLKEDLEQPTATRFPSRERLARLWDLHDRVMAVQPAHVAPLVWPQIEHQLVWLEQAALAGEAYHATFDRLGQSLDDQLNSILAAVRSPERSRTETASPARLAAVLSGDQTFLAQEFAVPSSAVAEYLGLTALAADGFGEASFIGFRNQLHPGESPLKSESGEPAIALHELAERLSVPRSTEKQAADFRAHRLVRPLLEDADQSRRLIEDRIIAGPQATLNLADQLADVRRRYDASAAVEETLARGYQVRDRAWSEVPYLILWSRCRNQPSSGETPIDNEPGADAPRPTKDELRGLVDRAAQLDAALQQVERQSSRAASAPEQLAAIDAVTAELEASLTQIRARLLEDAKRLSLAGSATSHTLCELTGILATPFVPGKLRSELRDRYGAVTEEVDRVVLRGSSKSGAGELAGSESPASSNGPPFDVTSESRTDVDRLVQLVTAMLGTGDIPTPSADASDPRALGTALREALQTATQSPRATPPVKPRQTEEPDQGGGELPTGWSDVPDMDRRLRRLATILPPLPDDPFRRLWHRSLQELLLWHGQRALDDFWGPSGPQREPLFAQAAESYLAAVRRLAQPDPEIASRIDQLTSLLEKRRQAARAAFVVTSTDVLLLADDADLTAQIGVQSTPPGRDLPSGTAAVFLGDEKGPLPTTIFPLDIDSSSEEDRPALSPVAVPVRSGELKTRGPAFQAAVMFRGHRFATPLMVRELAGTRIEITRHKYGPSRVTLTGLGRKRASIVFVVDCSHSMIDRVDVEAPSVSGQDSRPGKLNVAADALRTMLERFGEQGEMRIGVRFFGHRVGWRTDQTETLARQEAYPDPISPTLRPYEDVELFLPLGRFDSVIAGNVSRRLRELRPWGESPLYLALRQALLDFGPEDDLAEKYVVVITDGKNYQFNPPPESSPTLGEIEEAYSSRGIHVEIVGFAIPADEQATAFREFGELSTRTGGSFSVATNASSLIRDLQRRMVKTDFSVAQGDRVSGAAEVGGTIVVASAGEYEVQVEDLRATAALEGGENLQLAIGRDGERIVALPYEEGRPVFAPLIAPASLQPTGYRAGLHRPLRDAQAVVFPISFQTADAGIPTRLAHVWIEIAPLAAGRTAALEAYPFFDANYEPDTPVPLLHCRCPDWPAEADRAEVRVWCSPKAVPDAEVVPLETVANRVPPSGEGFSLTRMAGVAYQVLAVDSPPSAGPRRIRVVQRHEAGIPVNALKLDLSPPSTRRIHQFDANLGVVLHTFEYDPGDAPADSSVALRFQTRDQLNEAAWRLDRPVVLNVAKHTDVVSPPQILKPGRTP